MKRHLLSLIVLSFTWLSVSGQDAPQPKIYRYSTPTYVGNELITINHYRFDDRIIHIRCLDQYSSFESEQGDFIRFDLPGEWGCSINFRFVLLNEMPKDEKEAIKLYDSEVTKLSRLMVNGAKKDNRLKPNVGNFRRSYYMSSGPSEPLQEIITFFVQPPYLYIVQISSPKQVAAIHIVQCSKMLKSLAIESREKQPVTGAVRVSNAGQSAAVAGTNTPAAVDENAAMIQKMIADAFDSSSSNSQTGYEAAGGNKTGQ
jgi:hypothetical protein